MKPLLLTFVMPVTELTARVDRRTEGWWHSEDSAEPTAFVQVAGRVGGSPFQTSVTLVGFEDEARLWPGCDKDVASDAAWSLEPFLGALSKAQIEAIVSAVEAAAKEVV